MTNLEKIKSFTKDEMVTFLGTFDKDEIPYCNKEVCPNYLNCQEQEINCLEYSKGDYFDIEWWLDQETDKNNK